MSIKYLVVLLLMIGVIFGAWWNANSQSDRAYYFIEHNENNQPLSYGYIWVKGNFSTTPTQFYVYYNGDSEDTVMKNGKKVFSFFDEFEGTSINTTLWNCASGTCSVSNSIISHTYPLIDKTHGLITNSTYPLHQNSKIVYYAKCQASSSQRCWIGGEFHDTNRDMQMIARYSTYNAYTINEGISSSTAFTDWSSYSYIELERNTNFRAYKNRVLYSTLSSNLPDQNLYVAIWGEGGGIVYVDYVFVLYTPITPTVIYGPEQTGSWTLNGITYTKRKQVSVSASSSVSNQQIYLLYSQFNSTKIAITSYSPTTSQPSEATTYNTTAYEGTLQKYTTTTTNYNVSSAILEYDGVNYTATKLNSTSARAQITLPFVNTNATIKSFRWHINNGTTWRTFNYRNQTIIWSNKLTSTQNLPFVQQGTQTTINATITKYSNTNLTNSYAVLTFNGNNYTMTKINDTFFTKTITMPSQTEFVKKYSYSIKYYTTTSLLRSQQTRNITGIKYPTPQQPCSNYLEQSKNIQKYKFKENTQYFYISNSSTNCPNEFNIYFNINVLTSTNWCITTERYTSVNNGGTYMCDVGTPLIGFQSHIPFIENKTITVAFNPSIFGCYGGPSWYVRVYNSSNNYIELTTTGASAKWYLDTQAGLPKICKVGTSSCILSTDAKYFLHYYVNYYGCSGSSNWLTDNSLWIFNISQSFRQDYGKYVPYFSVSGSAKDFTLGEFKNYKTGETYSMFFNKDISNSHDIKLGTTTNQVFIFNKTSNAIYIRYGEQIANNYNAYVVTSNVQLIEPKYSIYIAKNTYGLPHTIMYMRFNESTYATTLYKDVATIIQDKYGICYFVPPYSPNNLSTTQTITGYQIPCESSVSEVSPLPLMPKLQLCRVINDTYEVNITYPVSVLYEIYIKDNNVVTYSQSNSETYNNKITITPTTQEITIKVNNNIRCYWNVQNALLGIGNLPHEEWTNKLIGYPLLIFISAISIYNPFLFIGAIAVNEFFGLVELTGLLLLAVGIGVFAVISNWGGERTLKTLIVLFLITGVYLIQLYAYAPSLSGHSSELTTKIQEISGAFANVSNSNDIIQIITIAIPTFLINIVVLLLELPALIVSIMFDAIISVVPQLTAPLLVFQNALIIGAYAWLVLKIYEIGRNTFRGV